MAFELEIRSMPSGSCDEYVLVTKFQDMLSLAPDYILACIVEKIANKFVEEHYAEIEKEIDVKVVAAVVSANMKCAIEDKLMGEVRRVQAMADQAMRLAKKNRS